MSLTADGVLTVAAWIAPQLAGAQLVVSDGGEQSASAPAAVTAVEGEITLRAEFGELDANFEWRHRSVRVGDVDFDVDELDMGRKPLGAIWALEVPIEVTA